MRPAGLLCPAWATAIRPSNDAIKAQLDKLAYAHTSFFTTEVAERLADHLVAHAPQGLGHVYYVSGGSEAMEAALKMARQYFVEKGEPQRRHFIGRRQSYHGNTLGVLAVGGNLWRRAQFAPMLFESHHVSPPYAYRDMIEGETVEAYGERLADELEARIGELGPGTVIAFVAETVGGATQGCTTAPPGYFKRIRKLCDRHGILLILDEVMCGMGRTGTLHACTQEDDRAGPDGHRQGPRRRISTHRRGAAARKRSSPPSAMGQGSSSMAIPISPIRWPAPHRWPCRRPSSATICSKTFRRQGAHLERRLRERFGNHHHVGDIRGRGLFWAVEYVTDRSSKTPFDPALKLNARVKREAMARGLACYAMPGTIDGKLGDHNMLAPPFICTNADIDRIVERFGDAVDAALQSLPRQ